MLLIWFWEKAVRPFARVFCVFFPAGVIHRSEFQPSEIMQYIEKVGGLETKVKGRHSNQTFIELHADDKIAIALDLKWVRAQVCFYKWRYTSWAIYTLWVAESLIHTSKHPLLTQGTIYQSAIKSRLLRPDNGLLAQAYPRVWKRNNSVCVTITWLEEAPSFCSFTILL